MYFPDCLQATKTDIVLIFFRWTMELKAAQDTFVNMLQQMQQPDTRKAFLMWIDNTFIRAGMI